MEHESDRLSDHASPAPAVRCNHILLIDDEELVVQAMGTLLHALSPSAEVRVCTSVASALQEAALERFDVVLLDWHLGGPDSAETGIDHLRQAGCCAAIVVVSGDTSAATIHRAIEHGAAGYVPKTRSPDQLLAAIERVLSGEIYLPQDALGAELPLDARREDAGVSRLIAQLSPRQQDVFRAAARGLPNKLIARELSIAESTVKTHLIAIYGTLGVRNRTEAAYLVSRHGLRVDRQVP